MVYKVFVAASICFEHCIYLMGFYLTSYRPSTPAGALKSSHSFSNPNIYCRRIASGSKDWVQSIILNDTKEREAVIFQKTGTRDLSKLFILCFQNLLFKLQISVPHSQLFWFGAPLEEVQKSAFLTHVPVILKPVAWGPRFKLWDWTILSFVCLCGGICKRERWSCIKDVSN